MTLEQENKELRDNWFAKFWNNKLSYEGVDIDDGAMKLQQMGIIPSITEPGGEARTRGNAVLNWRTGKFSFVS